ncbi:hypothetical protein NMY22_g1790 [Coprinellus aureogranulatus]|nr:hypothetical protein NMY22_g1790 [Coprinellus aureogranulatus]
MSALSADASALQSLQEALGVLKGELEKKDKHIEDLRSYVATLKDEVARLKGEPERVQEELKVVKSGVAHQTDIGSRDASIGERALVSSVPEKRKLEPDTPPAPPKKRGRPRKSVVPVIPAKLAVLPLPGAPKKRGRPRKNKLVEQSPVQEATEVPQPNTVTRVDLDAEPQSFPASSINSSQAFVFSPGYTASILSDAPSFAIHPSPDNMVASRSLLHVRRSGGNPYQTSNSYFPRRILQVWETKDVHLPKHEVNRQAGLSDTMPRSPCTLRFANTPITTHHLRFAMHTEVSQAPLSELVARHQLIAVLEAELTQTKQELAFTREDARTARKLALDLLAENNTLCAQQSTHTAEESASIARGMALIERGMALIPRMKQLFTSERLDPAFALQDFDALELMIEGVDCALRGSALCVVASNLVAQAALDAPGCLASVIAEAGSAPRPDLIA